MVIAPNTSYRGRFETLDYSEDYRPRESSDPLLLVRPAIRRAVPTATTPMVPIIVDKGRLADVTFVLRGGPLRANVESRSNPGVLTLDELASRQIQREKAREQRDKSRKHRATRLRRGAFAAVVLVAAAFAAGTAVHRAPHWITLAAGR
jgi:hypothetical protein